MRGCECTRGCVCCTHSPSCTQYNGRQDKVAALALIDALLREDDEPAGARGGDGDSGGASDGAVDVAALRAADGDADATSDALATLCVPCAEVEPSGLGRFEL